MIRLLGAFLLWFAVAIQPVLADEVALRLGVLAYRPQPQALAQWQPLAQWLQTQLSRPVQLSVYDLVQLEVAVAQKQVDIVLTTGGHFIALKNRYGLSAPLATQITRAPENDLTTFGGVIFTRADRTDIGRLSDLTDKRIAVASTDFTAGYPMPVLVMRESGLAAPNASQLVITGLPQDLTVNAVLQGKADAGFVRTGILEALVHEGHISASQVKLVHPQTVANFPFATSTPLYPEWPVVVMSHVEAKLARQLAVALLSLHHDDPAAIAAGIGGFTIPADYAPVENLLRRLGMPPFDATQESTLRDFWTRHSNRIVLSLALLMLASIGLVAWLLIQNARVRSSQALHRAQSKRVSEIIWSTNIGTWEWDLRSAEVVLNARLADILGYTLAELAPSTSHHLAQYIHPDDRVRSNALLAQCFRREIENYTCEVRARQKNGDWVWVLSRGRVVAWDRNGKAERMSGTLADISVRHRAVQRQVHHNHILALLTDKTPLATILEALALGVESISPGVRCCVLLFDETTQRLHPGAAPSLPGFYQQAMLRLADNAAQPPCAKAALSGERIIVSDIANDSDWAAFTSLAREAALAACWSQPILAVDGRVLGTIALYHSRVRNPSEQDLDLLDDEARLAALVIEKTSNDARMQLAANVFTHAREGILITDVAGNIVDVNDTFCHITGYSAQEAKGKNPRMLSSGRQDAHFYAQLWKSLNEQGHWSGELWNRRKSGEFYAEAMTISAVKDAAGKVANYVALFTDITATKEHQNELERFAHFDPLTGLPNRVLLADRLQQAIAQSQRRNQALAVAYLDLDGFKAINDVHGHAIGDDMLIALSQRMKAALRDGDTLARIGGDEFVAVLADLAHPTDCEAVLERLLLAAAEPVQMGDTVQHVSASIGVTLYPQDAADADQLMRHADQAMYVAKLSGKNRFHHFDVAHDTAIKTHHDALEQIRHALDHQEFVLYYQPKVNMKTGEKVGAEALIRWQHPVRGLLAPAAFLPIIENHPISNDLGEWVMDTALAQMAQWMEQGLRFPVSVNIGVRQLQQHNFVSRLSALLQRYPTVAPLSLELEVLETSAMEDITQVSGVMHACRALGVGFALDDFGTGYSSLTYLKHLPAELLKIDQSFVRDMLDDPDDLAIVESVIGLAAAFRRNVIAEGVETAVHGELLLALGCDMAQGYGIARPMPAANFPDWAQQWQPDASWTAWRERVLSRDDKAVVFVEVGHRHWLRCLESYLNGETPETPTLAASDCHFGRWEASDGQSAYGHDPRFAELVHLHEDAHRQVQALITLFRAAQPEQARLGLPVVRNHLEQLAVQMHALIRP